MAKEGKKPWAKGKAIGVRVTDEERAELQAGADLHCKGNLSQYIRQLALATHRRKPYEKIGMVPPVPDADRPA